MKPNFSLDLPTTFFLPIDWSARALMTLPRLLRDWLIAEPSFSLSPVAPVESALSLCKIIFVYKTTTYNMISLTCSMSDINKPTFSILTNKSIHVLLFTQENFFNIIVA